MLRKEYWERSKELIDYCNEEELKVLGQQANKELNNRINKYIGKFEMDESHDAKKLKREIKAKAIKKNIRRL